jgi:hypothetical protein
MSANEQPDKLALQTAEEILRTIYGDDFAGCTVSLEKIAGIIDQASQAQHQANHELLGLYEKLVEALHLLSTPPDASKITDPNELRTLLSERLDAIHALTTKTMDTTARAKDKTREA